jgi:hypothetical protein
MIAGIAGTAAHRELAHQLAARWRGVAAGYVNSGRRPHVFIAACPAAACAASPTIATFDGPATANDGPATITTKHSPSVLRQTLNYR